MEKEEIKEREIISIKEEIFEKAGKRNKEEIESLISLIERILELAEEKNKIENKIEEIKEKSYFQEGGIAYLPAKGEAIIIGDTHGDSFSTKRIIEKEKIIEGLEKEEEDLKIIFLGDYADRGKEELKNLEIILSLKEKYPKNIILLRGNHEEGPIVEPYTLNLALSKRYGLEDGEELHQKYLKLFEKLPNILICENGLVAVHGGIPSEEINSLKDLKNNETFFKQMRWNDPTDETKERKSNIFKRGIYQGAEKGLFGKNALERFLENIGGKILIRSHQTVEQGVELKFNNKLATIFSTGIGSEETGYSSGVFSPKYAKINLETKINSFNEENFFETKY